MLTFLSRKVYIMMPNLQNLQIVAERMKALSEHIIVSANMAGEFTIKVETDLVQVETFYHGLLNPELGGCNDFIGFMVSER